jgi:tetratricopeptide (TPR) repeat protein
MPKQQNTKQQNKSAVLQEMLAQATQSHRAGQLAVAEVLYRDILKLDPKQFDALHMLALIGYQTGQIADCLPLFEQASKLRPNDARMLINYGAALRKAQRYDDALEAYDKALAIQPTSSEALFNKAQCLALDKKQFDEAIHLYRESLRYAPNDTDAWTALGNACGRVGQWREAIEHYERAIQINPKAVLPHVAMAQLFRDREWITAAILLYDKALTIAPRDAIARTHRAVALLRNGQLREGWTDYDGRFWYLDEQVVRRPLPPPYWDGEALDGKSILVWSEQGIGDEILNVSVLPDIIKSAKYVALQCDPRMVPIYKRSFPSVEVFGWIDGMPRNPHYETLDFQCAIGSLGRFCRNDFSDFPRHRGYLSADPGKVAHLKARYGGGPLVGISWKSSATRIGDAKTLLLKDWVPILRQAGARFISLQYGDTAAEIDQLKSEFGIDVLLDKEIDSLVDMDAFAAQVAAMDLVISTSNTTVHMAGSLGIPTWTLLPLGPGALWYWFLRREDSPWYPSVKLYRQRVQGDWGDVVEHVSADFRKWLTQYKDADAVA